MYAQLSKVLVSTILSSNVSCAKNPFDVCELTSRLTYRSSVPRLSHVVSFRGVISTRISPSCRRSASGRRGRSTKVEPRRKLTCANSSFVRLDESTGSNYQVIVGKTRLPEYALDDTLYDLMIRSGVTFTLNLEFSGDHFFFSGKSEHM